MLLQALCDILDSLATGSIQSSLLWLSTVETLTKSLENDDGGESILVRLCHRRTTYHSQCSGATTSWPLWRRLAMDDALLKSINFDLLMHTRAEDARERIFVLSCAEAL